MPVDIKRWNSFSATNATQGSKDHLHQTEPPNALPASERCPGQPRVKLRVCLNSPHPVRFRSWQRPVQLCRGQPNLKPPSAKWNCLVRANSSLNTGTPATKSRQGQSKIQLSFPFHRLFSAHKLWKHPKSPRNICTRKWNIRPTPGRAGSWAWP